MAMAIPTTELESALEAHGGEYRLPILGKYVNGGNDDSDKHRVGWRTS